MDKPVRKRQRLSKAERRQQLLACALRVAARSGLGRLVHADIAQEAGVSVPTAFLYFPNREALLQAVVGEVSRFYYEQAKPFHDGSYAPRDAILQHCLAYARSVDSHPEQALIWLEWSTSARNECGIWDLFLEHNDGFIRLLSRRIREAWDTRAHRNAATDAARLIMGSVFAVTQMALAQGPEGAVERFVILTVDTALRMKPEN